MPLFSRKKKEGAELFVVYDIGSASVGGAVVLSGDGDHPRLLFTTSKEFSFDVSPDADYFKARVSAAFASVVTETEHHVRTARSGSLAHVPFRNAFVILSAPWYVSQVRHIHVAHPTPFHIREEDILGYANKEYEAFLASPMVQEFDGGDEYEAFEKHVIQVRLNGYETAEPSGKEAKTLDMSVIFSVMSSSLGTGIRDEIARIFTGLNVSFYTFPFTVFDTVRRMKPELTDLFFLDIAGEVSELALVKDGTLSGSVSFPVGKATLVRHVAHSLHVSVDEAVSAVRMYADKDVSKAEAKRIGNALASAAKFWARPFEHALDTFKSEGVVLPRTIYMTTDEDVAVWLSSLVETETANMSAYEAGACSVIRIDAPYVHSLYRIDEGVARDVFLILPAIFAARSLEPVSVKKPPGSPVR